MIKNRDNEFITTIPEKKYTKNMFTSPLGDKYAKKFFNVYNASLNNRDELMRKIYEEGQNDNSLNEKQKKIITGCYIAYLSATGKKTVAFPLVLFIKNKKPNLTKYLNEKRIKRVIEDLYSFVEKTGFDFECYLLMDYLTRFLHSFSKLHNHRDSTDASFELYLIIALSRFVRSLSPIAYQQMWFALMMLKNISLLSFVNIQMIDETLIEEIKNLIKLINIIHVLELERAETVLQTREEEDIQERSVLLPNDNIELKSELLKEEKEEISININKNNENEVLNPESSYFPIIENKDDLNQMINNENE